MHGVFSPLKPKGWLDMLFDNERWDEDALLILDGVYPSFRVIDPGADVPIYDCENYKSCFDEYNFGKMNDIITSELASDKVSIAIHKPNQIHALGAIPKPNGSIRHITDCSLPDRISVNNYMKSTFSTFAYKM